MMPTIKKTFLQEKAVEATKQKRRKEESDAHYLMCAF
jgi:hypothetical protein